MTREFGNFDSLMTAGAVNVVVINHKDVYKAVSPHTEYIGQLLQFQQNFNHQQFHIHQGLNEIRFLSSRLGLKISEQDKAERIYRYHDIGWKLVDIGQIKPSEHHLAEAVITEEIDPDRLVTLGVLLHNQDVLPQGTPLVIRLVRDVDRVLDMSYLGAFRWAIANGFRDPQIMNFSPDDIMDRGLVIDLSQPFSDNNEENLQTYFYEHIVPFCIQNHVCTTMIEEAKLRLNRFWGVRADGLRGDLMAKEERKQSKWVVEPILEELQGLYSRKAHNTSLIQNCLSQYA